MQIPDHCKAGVDLLCKDRILSAGVPVVINDKRTVGDHPLQGVKVIGIPGLVPKCNKGVGADRLSAWIIG